MSLKITESSKMSKAKGATRNLTQQFLKFKNVSKGPATGESTGDIDSRNNRFQPLKTNFLLALSSNNSGNYYPYQEGGTYSGVTSP